MVLECGGRDAALAFHAKVKAVSLPPHSIVLLNFGCTSLVQKSRVRERTLLGGRHRLR
jgi:hypothetical protein